VVAGVLYESRSDDLAPRPRLGGGRLAQAVSETEVVARELADVEGEAGLPGRGQLDLGLVVAVHAWARGGHLEDVIDVDLAAGDFVRWAKQVIDLLDQLSGAAPTRELRDVAHAGVAAVRRGIVALGSV
jgi:ATP-dependent RNA helicase HelY